jgi:hypothetical protein
MSDHPFQIWQREREAVEQEMNQLLATVRAVSAEERQVRRFRFEALVERRETAARNLMQSDRAVRDLRLATR